MNWEKVSPRSFLPNREDLWEYALTGALLSALIVAAVPGVVDWIQTHAVTVRIACGVLIVSVLAVIVIRQKRLE